MELAYSKHEASKFPARSRIKPKFLHQDILKIYETLHSTFFSGVIKERIKEAEYKE